MNKYASFALAFLLVFSGCLGGSDNDLATDDNTVEPVGETDFTSLEKDLENLTTKINAEIARLDNLETLVEGIDDSEDTLEALGCGENEIAAYDGMEWRCAHVQQFLPPLDEAVWDIISSEFEEVRDDLEYAKNMTDYIWSEFDYIENSMNDTVDKIYADMNVIVQFLEDGDEELYNHMSNMSEMIHDMNVSVSEMSDDIEHLYDDVDHLWEVVYEMQREMDNMTEEIDEMTSEMEEMQERINELENMTSCRLVPYSNCAGKDFNNTNLSGMVLTGINFQWN